MITEIIQGSHLKELKRCRIHYGQHIDRASPRNILLQKASPRNVLPPIVPNVKQQPQNIDMRQIQNLSLELSANSYVEDDELNIENFINLFQFDKDG